jgi:hypothetical protein
MTSAHLVRHAHPYAGPGHALKRRGRIFRAPRLIPPHEFNLFCDRLDDAREYEGTIHDFALLHDLALSTDDYDS